MSTNEKMSKAPSPDSRYNSETHNTPLWLDTKPVFLGRVEWCDGKRSGVAILGTGATLRVDRDEEMIRYSRKLRFLFDENGKIKEVMDERGFTVDLASWGSYETADKSVLTLDVISEQPNPRWEIAVNADGTVHYADPST